MKKTLVTFITLVAAVFAAKAQTVETVQEYTNFSSIEASDYFEIKLVHGTSYSAKIVADQLIAENVQVFVKGSTLNLDVDEKKYAPEVKKALKGKNEIVDLMLIAVKPEYQSKGVNSLIFTDLIPNFIANGYVYAESNPELEANDKVQKQWEYFDFEQHKRRRAFTKEI